MFRKTDKSNPLERCPFAGCGELVRRSALASHWVIAGHANPNVRAVAVRFPLDAGKRAS